MRDLMMICEGLQPPLAYPSFAPKLPADRPARAGASMDWKSVAPGKSLDDTPARGVKHYPSNEALWSKSKLIGQSLHDDAEEALDYAKTYYRNHGGKWRDSTRMLSIRRMGMPLDKGLWQRSKRMARTMFDDGTSPEALQWASGYYRNHGGKFLMSPGHASRSTVDPVSDDPAPV